MQYASEYAQKKIAVASILIVFSGLKRGEKNRYSRDCLPQKQKCGGSLNMKWRRPGWSKHKISKTLILDFEVIVHNTFCSSLQVPVSEALHSKFFPKTLILALEANKFIVLPKWNFFRVLASCFEFEDRVNTYNKRQVSLITRGWFFFCSDLCTYLF